MTDLMYLKDPHTCQASAEIVGKGSDDKGLYLIFDRSVFYPQGGGQPADQGWIDTGAKEYSIYDVRSINSKICHYVDKEAGILEEGMGVQIKVNKDIRSINTAYHSAGHLIAAMAQILSPQLIAEKGHQFPGQAYIQFQGIVENIDTFTKQLKILIDNQISENSKVTTKNISKQELKDLAQNLPYSIDTDKQMRVCHIKGQAPVPCGGTHVNNLGEIGPVDIIKCKSKKGKTKICYKLANFETTIS